MQHMDTQMRRERHIQTVGTSPSSHLMDPVNGQIRLSNNISLIILTSEKILIVALYQQNV